jgi:hypothetical protein
MANNKSRRIKSGASVSKDDRKPSGREKGSHATNEVEKRDSAEVEAPQHDMTKDAACFAPVVAVQDHSGFDIKQVWGIPMIEVLSRLEDLLRPSSPQLVSTLRNCRRNILEWVKSTSRGVHDSMLTLLDAFLSYDLNKHVLTAVTYLLPSRCFYRSRRMV